MLARSRSEGHHIRSRLLVASCNIAAVALVAGGLAVGSTLLLNATTPSAATEPTCTTTTAPASTDPPLTDPQTTDPTTTDSTTTTTSMPETSITEPEQSTTTLDINTSNPDTSESTSTSTEGPSPTPTIDPADTVLFTAASESCDDVLRSRPTLLSSGYRHTCALPGDGTVKCWGRNRYGQLGNNSFADLGERTTVLNITDAISVEAFDEGTCAIRATGRVLCWGRYGPAPGDQSTTPVEMAGITTAVAFLGDGKCVLVESGAIECWAGDHRVGDAIRDYTAGNARLVKAPMDSSNLAGNATCALLDTGLVKCWGGVLWSHFQPFPEKVYVTDAIDVDVGSDSACAVHVTGAVSCWGYNEVKQLGGRGTDSLATPRAVGVQNATSVAVGFRRACAAMTSGSVVCWGLNQFGELGIGYTSTAPEWSEGVSTVLGISDAVSVTAGFGQFCALRADNSVFCWGQNFQGELGNGAMAYSMLPVRVTDIDNAVDVSTGNKHACAVLDDGTVRCWGPNARGQLGTGSNVPSDRPVAVVGVTGAVQVSAGGEHTCALLTDKTVKCWGMNLNGQVGSGWLPGGYTNSPAVLVPDIANALQVVAGGTHSCALIDDGTVKCWGDPSAMSPQGNANIPSTGVAQEVPGLDSVVQIASPNINGTCVLRSDRTVECWGQNWGERARVPAFDGAVSISGGGSNTRLCAVMSDSRVVCKRWADDPWMNNTVVTGATGTSAGEFGACAIVGGPVKCWGIDTVGQLGNGRLVEDASQVPPQDVVGLTTATKLSSSVDYSCALLGDRTIRCWGSNLYGSLGAGMGQTLSLVANDKPIGGITPSVGTVLPASGNVDGFQYSSRPSRAIGVTVVPPAGYRPGFGITLTVSRSGDGQGAVSSAPTGINCPSVCSIVGLRTSTYVLTATASTGSRFDGWSGAGCSGTGTCSVSLANTRAVTARFVLNDAGGSSTTSASSTSVLGPGASATPGNRSARISWPGDAWPTFGSIAAFQIERSGDGGKTWRSAARVPKTRRTHVVTRLTNGVSYRFRIRAVRGRSYGDWIASNDVTPRTVPSQPRLVRATPGNGKLVVTWLAPLSNGGSPVIEYRVQTSTNGRTWSLPITVGIGPTSSNSTTLGSLQNGVKLFVRVIAVNAAGLSRGTVSRRVAPAAPLP